MNGKCDQGYSPIIDMLDACISEENISFHMPGHNNASGFSDWLKQNALRIDTTEFDLTDDINDPAKTIIHAEKLAAEAFGAGHTFFVTTGASMAVHASVVSLSTRGDIIIADRGSHSSLINSCRLYGIRVVFGFKDQIPDLIAEYPEAAFVFVTRPDYYGFASDIDMIIRTAHDNNIPVVVDESHGSHYAFAPEIMPVPALSAGADVVIHSAHKTLPVLTQGAFLHISKSFTAYSNSADDVFRNSLKAVSTSSPSFLIAATLDYARTLMAAKGRKLSHDLYGSVSAFVRSLPPALADCFSLSRPADSAFVMYDPFRLCFTPGNAFINIKEIYDKLTKSGIFPEFADLTDIVMICKFTNTSDDFINLADILVSSYNEVLSDADKQKDNADDFRKRAMLKEKIKSIMELSCSTVISPGCLPFSDRDQQYIEITSALDHIICEPCTIYPPGIPLLIPGQKFTREILEAISDLLYKGVRINGIKEEISSKTGKAIYKFKARL